MDGFEVQRKRIHCGVSSEGAMAPRRIGGELDTILDEESGSTYINAEGRHSLMEKLMGKDSANPYVGVSASTLAQYNVQNQPSCSLLLSNLFNPRDVDLVRDPTFFLDVKEDVIGIYIYIYIYNT